MFLENIYVKAWHLPKTKREQKIENTFSCLTFSCDGFSFLCMCACVHADVGVCSSWYILFSPPTTPNHPQNKLKKSIMPEGLRAKASSFKSNDRPFKWKNDSVQVDIHRLEWVETKDQMRLIFLAIKQYKMEGQRLHVAWAYKLSCQIFDHDLNTLKRSNTNFCWVSKQ